MNDIVKSTAFRGAISASTACSPVLWQRCTDRSLSFSDAVKELAADPDLASEIVSAKHRLEIAAAPAKSGEIIAVLVPLGFYITALGDLPLEAIREGVAEYTEQETSEFFPKPGPLKAICRRKAEPVLMALGRVRAAARLVQA